MNLLHRPSLSPLPIEGMPSNLVVKLAMVKVEIFGYNLALTALFYLTFVLRHGLHGDSARIAYYKHNNAMKQDICAVKDNPLQDS